MFRPMKAGTLATCFTLIAGAVLLGACAGEVTAPVAPPQRAIEATAMFVPSAAAKALIGVADGTYSVTFSPMHDQELYLGPNHLSLPAGSICNLGTSGYGPAYWNRPCFSQTRPVTLTIKVKGAASANPNVSFYPAMRFNPTKNVQLFMYAPKVSVNDAKNWLMFYCPDVGSCVNESLTDKALVTYIDYTHNILFRRVKHFSGYTVAEFADTTVSAPL